MNVFKNVDLGTEIKIPTIMFWSNILYFNYSNIL